MALTPQPQQQGYNSLNFGVAADGATDDTAAWNALFALVVTNGGGTIYLPDGRTSLCTGSLVPFPWVNSTGNQVGLRLQGVAASPGDTGFTTGSVSTLDLRYAGSNTWILNITATGGTYTLTYNSVATGNITYNNTAAQVQTALNAISGGSALRVSGTFPTYIINVAPLTLTVQTGSLTGGSATLANPIAKIDNRQHGQFELDHLTLKSGGSDDFLFYQTTNTATYAHDLLFQGHTANSGASCVQDAMYFGGTGTGINTGAATDRFQGYSTRMDRVFFENIRTGFRLQTSANAIVGNECVWSSTCGGDTTHGAITIVSTNGGSGAAVANRFNNSLIEVGNAVSTVNYPFAVVLGTNALNNAFVGTQVFDGVAGCLTVSDSSGNSGNRFFGTYTSGTQSGGGADTPDTMSEVSITSGTTFVLTGPNGNYQIICIGGGGGGGGGGTPSSALNGQVGGSGGAQGTSAQAFMTLVSGTAYTIAIGAKGNATGTTTAGGNAGAAGNAGGATTFAGPSFTLSGAGGNAGSGGGASSTTAQPGGSATSVANLTAGGNPLTNAASVSTADGWGGSNFVFLGTTTCAGGSPQGFGGGGGGGGGSANTTNGGSGGGAGAYGQASGGAPHGSGSANGTAGASAAATSYGAGGGGGGAGATATGTGGAGGAGAPGVIIVIGPYPAN